jgi:Clp amino terminal domain, pathogenicity island component
MMTLDDQLLNEAKTVRERLLDLQHEVDRARVDYQHVIRRLHAKGGSMREIAEELGLSHQRVHQIVDAGPEDAREPRGFRRGRNARFARFTRYARAAVEQAHAESEALGHGYIGTEHVLLGLLKTEGGGAAAALESLGVSYDGIRGEVEKMTITPHAGRRGMPMTAKTKKAFHLALDAARDRSARRAGTEDLLVGLASVHDGLAAELLTAAGADEARVREAVTKVLGR